MSTPAGERPLRQLVVIAELGSGGAESVVVQLAAAAAGRGGSVVVASAGGWREEVVVRAGADHLTVPLAGAGWRGALRSVLLLRGRLRTAPVDVVHAHNVRATVVARLALVGRRPRPPVVATVHGLPARRYRTAARLLRWTTDAVVAVSPDVAERLVAGGTRPERLRVIDNAPVVPTATGRGPARDELGLPQSGAVVLHLARMAPPKRPDLLVRAVVDLPGVHVLLAGDGPLRPEVGRLVDALDLTDRVALLGDRQDVSRLLAAADVVVLASDSEGLPITVLEAMAAGTPVVASRVGGLAELDPGALTLVDPGDVDALRLGLSRLLDDPRRAARQAEQAGLLVARRFSTEAMDAGYHRLLGELVDGRAPGSRIRP